MCRDENFGARARAYYDDAHPDGGSLERDAQASVSAHVRFDVQHAATKRCVASFAHAHAKETTRDSDCNAETSHDGDREIETDRDCSH